MRVEVMTSLAQLSELLMTTNYAYRNRTQNGWNIKLRSLLMLSPSLVLLNMEHKIHLSLTYPLPS